MEILARLEEARPNLPPMAPETLGSRRTLRQVAEVLASGPADALGSHATAAPAQTANERPGLAEALTAASTLAHSAFANPV